MPRMDDLDRRLTRIAERQLGLVTTGDLRRLGIDRQRVTRRRVTGRLVPVHPGVDRIAGAPITADQQLLAACLAVGGHASHFSAAARWGLEVRPMARADVLVAHERRPRLDAVRLHRSRHLTAPDLTTNGPIPTVTPARALLDLAAPLGSAKLGRVLDQGERHGIVRADELWACAHRFGINGARLPVALAQVLERRLADDRVLGDSAGEQWIADVLRRAGLPTPVSQYPVWAGGRWYLLDFAYPDDLLDLEFDGFAVHRVRTSFDEDRARDAALVALGWRVLRFTSGSTEAGVVGSVSHGLGLWAPASAAGPTSAVA